MIALLSLSLDCHVIEKLLTVSIVFTYKCRIVEDKPTAAARKSIVNHRSLKAATDSDHILIRMLIHATTRTIIATILIAKTYALNAPGDDCVVNG